MAPSLASILPPLWPQSVRMPLPTPPLKVNPLAPQQAQQPPNFLPQTRHPHLHTYSVAVAGMGWAYSLWCGPSPPAPWRVGGCPCASQITPPKRCFICPRHNQAWTMHHSHLYIANDLTHSRCPSAPHLCPQPLPRAEAPPRLHRHQYESPTILPCLWWEGGQEVK